VTAVVSVGKAKRLLAPEVVRFDGRSVRSRGPALPGVVVVEDDPAAGDVQAIYIPKGASRFLAVRLFLLGERLPMFPSVEGIPTAAAQGGGLYNRALIWGVRSPRSLGPAPAASFRAPPSGQSR
jgi:hypothetical protein